jgi:hypothetical protein
MFPSVSQGCALPPTVFVDDVVERRHRRQRHGEGGVQTDGGAVCS